LELRVLLVVLPPGKTDVGSNHTLWLESEGNVLQIPEALHQQSCPDYQSDGKADLRCN
jgi:hypothetical protein